MEKSCKKLVLSDYLKFELNNQISIVGGNVDGGIIDPPVMPDGPGGRP